VRKKYLIGALAVASASALMLTGCVNNTGSSGSSSSTAVPTAAKYQKAIDQLPADVKSSGKLVIGSDLSNPPSTYQTPSGAPTGWEIELANEVASSLGLKADVQNAQFDNILPSVVGGKYALGVSGYFDTKQREQTADMIDYYDSGVKWASLKGKTVDPDNACGLKVAAQANTYESQVDLPAKSEACTKAGKQPIDILAFNTEQEFTSAVTLGRAAAMTADAPVIDYMVKQSDGKLQFAGKLYSPFVLGIVVSKDNPKLRSAVVMALQHLVDSGTYGDVLKKWGIQDGAISKVTVNGATS
jgi:polar amino acid transport system substrate-binding protein